MGATVIVNNMTVVHKKSGGISTAFPDVCKTPTPAGPIPIPYPNIAMSSDTDKGSKKVKMDGEAIMHEGSNFKMSTGDEAGSAQGVVSNKIKGKAYPKAYSMDVKVEGKSVFRLLDIMLQNGGSPTNTPPMPELQAPLMALLANADFQFPEVTEVEWSRVRLKCGDEVKIKVKTSNYNDGSPVLVTALRGALPLGIFVEPIQGDEAEIDWITRTGPLPEESNELDLLAVGVGGVATAADKLDVQCPAEVKEDTGKLRRTIPKLELVPTPGGGTTYQLHSAGGNYGWDYGFETEIKDGLFYVRGKIKLEPQDGLVLRAKHKRRFKRAIESIWSRKWRVHREECKRGDTCNCWGGCCTFKMIFEVLFVSSGQHAEVKVWPGEPADYPAALNMWWNSGNWFMNSSGVGSKVYAHEYGHAIGQYDEYSAGAWVGAVNFTTDASGSINVPYGEVLDSLMGSGAKIKENHLDDYHAWFEGKVGESYKRLEL